jgi:glyoxylase-like metal-dependent hydrolase (beta-lactamase superfamily II)
VTVRARHIVNDHTDDGCVLFVEPDRVLFVGDATCDSPAGCFTTGLAFPLLDALLALGAEHVVEGHNDKVLSGAEFEELARKIRLAGNLVERFGPDEAAVLAELKDEPDQETVELAQAFVAGRA